MKYIKNLSWIGLEKIAKLLSIFLTSIIVSRTLSSEMFGVYSFNIAVFGILLSVISYGLDELYFQKFVCIKRKKTLTLYIDACIKIRLSLALFIILAVCLYSYHKNTYYLLILCFYYPFLSIDIFSIYNNAKAESYKNAKSNIISFILFTPIKMIGLIYKFEVEYFIFVYLFENILRTVLYYISFKSLGIKIIKRENPILIKIVKRSFPIMISSLALVVYYRIDQIMLGLMIGYKSVAIYSIQAQLIMGVNLILQIVINGLFPAIFTRNMIDTRKLVSLYQIVSLIIFLLWLLSLLFSKSFISFIWGGEYKEAGKILSITIFGCFFSGIGYVSSKYMIHKKLEVVRMYRVILSMLINIILNIILIPYYGVTGAAFATVIANLYSGYIGNFFNRKTRSIFWHQSRSFNPLYMKETIKLIKV